MLHLSVNSVEIIIMSAWILYPSQVLSLVLTRLARCRSTHDSFKLLPVLQSCLLVCETGKASSGFNESCVYRERVNQSERGRISWGLKYCLLSLYLYLNSWSLGNLYFVDIRYILIALRRNPIPGNPLSAGSIFIQAHVSGAIGVKILEVVDWSQVSYQPLQLESTAAARISRS